MEIEAKYSVLDPETARSLASMSQIASDQLRPGETQEIRDTYMDTPDQRLMAASYACRRRDNGSTSRINLKGLGSSDGTVHRREEVSLTIDEATLTTPHAWAEGAARETVLSLGDHQDLHILFEIRQTRHIRYVVHPDRGEIAELSLDDVTFLGQEWQKRATELEIELLEPGVEEDLEQITAALVACPGLVPQPTSKFERGMGVVYRHSGIGAQLDLGNVQKDDTIGEATRKLLRPLFLRMQLHEQGTYMGEDLEELHDLRVMTRRMRTAFRMAEPYLIRNEVKRIRRGLRKTARLLGAVRDMDVFRQKTEDVAAKAGIAMADLGFLTEVWDVEYARRRNEMLRYLTSRPYGRFKQDLWAKLSTRLPELQPPSPVRDVVHHIISDQLATLLAQGEVVERPNAPLSAYHQLRIDVKHLRYTLTFFQDLLGPETGPALAVLETLQDYFGDLQDAVVATGHLRAVAQCGTWEMPRQVRSLWQACDVASGVQPPTRGLRALLAAREAEIDALVAGALAMWRGFQEREVPDLIQKALRAL
ncbi:MAG: CHAD domain-containing protein [Anaerolineae bacterium]|nr:CHAD domain-containing protein [Anaerolineae bacterium]